MCIYLVPLKNGKKKKDVKRCFQKGVPYHSASKLHWIQHSLTGLQSLPGCTKDKDPLSWPWGISFFFLYEVLLQYGIILHMGKGDTRITQKDTVLDSSIYNQPLKYSLYNILTYLLIMQLHIYPLIKGLPIVLYLTQISFS